MRLSDDTGSIRSRGCGGCGGEELQGARLLNCVDVSGRVTWNPRQENEFNGEQGRYSRGQGRVQSCVVKIMASYL